MQATLLSIDTRQSRSDHEAGVLTPKPFIIKKGEAALTMRVLIDRSVVEAFAMEGRAAMTRRMYVPMHMPL